MNYPHLPRLGLPSPRFVRWGLPRSTTRLADSPGIHSGLTLRRRGFGPSHAYLSALRSACEDLSFQLLYYHAQYRFVSIVHQAIARLRTTKTAGVSLPYSFRSLRKGPYPPAIQVKRGNTAIESDCVRTMLSSTRYTGLTLSWYLVSPQPSSDNTLAAARTNNSR